MSKIGASAKPRKTKRLWVNSERIKERENKSVSLTQNQCIIFSIKLNEKIAFHWLVLLALGSRYYFKDNKSTPL